jgi:hypothetical protein
MFSGFLRFWSIAVSTADRVFLPLDTQYIYSNLAFEDLLRAVDIWRVSSLILRMYRRLFNGAV